MTAELSQESNEVLDRIPAFTGESTPAPDTSTPQQETGQDGGEQAQSSEPGTPKTALEAAERVMERAREASLASAQQPQPGAPQEPLKAQADELKAGDAKLPFAQHPRWKEATSEIRILRVAKEKNEAAIKDLEPKAGTFDQLSGWLRENNLGQQDLTNLFAIGSAVRNDPIKAHELLKPIMEELESMIGERLPQDLQNAVAQGSMTEEAARAIARARGEATIYKGRSESLEQRRQQETAEREAQEQQRHADTLVQSIVAHTEAWAARDPDAARKRPFVEEAVELELRKRDAAGNAPRSAEEATQIVDAVVKAVNDRFRAMTPQRRPVTSGILPNGATPPSQSAPIPKSSLEAAQLALSRGGGG